MYQKFVFEDNDIFDQRCQNNMHSIDFYHTLLTCFLLGEKSSLLGSEAKAW